VRVGLRCWTSKRGAVPEALSDVRELVPIQGEPQLSTSATVNRDPKGAATIAIGRRECVNRQSFFSRGSFPRLVAEIQRATETPLWNRQEADCLFANGGTRLFYCLLLALYVVLAVLLLLGCRLAASVHKREQQQLTEEQQQQNALGEAGAARDLSI